MDDLLSAWGIQGARLRPVGEGTNNTNFFAGDEFVLRVHQNTATPEYEHAVLRALGGLAFDVPVPVVTKDGATVARGVLDGNVVTASLSRRIVGKHPRRGDVVQAQACGGALAELDLALARLDPRVLPPPRNDWDRDRGRAGRPAAAVGGQIVRTSLPRAWVSVRWRTASAASASG